ncbi:MAG: hypothetical protein QXS38_00180 [Candidatus Pacearchaeota archaeon]
MKGKKGDLLNNVLTTIIAVIGLALLAYAAWRIYAVYANQDETSAKKTINFIDNKIDSISAGQNVIITVKGIEGWFLTGWQRDDASRPDKCALYSCICICKGDISGGERDGKLFVYEGSVFNQRESPQLCQETGFCREFNVDKIIILGSKLSYSKQASSGASSGSWAPTTIPQTTSAIFSAIKFANNILFEINASKEKEVDGKITLKLELTS